MVSWWWIPLSWIICLGVFAGAAVCYALFSQIRTTLAARSATREGPDAQVHVFPREAE